MTDDEVRARLARIRRGDPVTMGLALFNALQMAAIFLLFGDGSAFTRWMAYLLLGVLAGAIAYRAVVVRRDARRPSEELRAEYGKSLAGAYSAAQTGRVFFGVWVGLAAFNGFVFAMRSSRDSGWVVAPMMIGGFVMALSAYHQWKVIVPRLGQERADYRQGVVA